MRMGRYRKKSYAAHQRIEGPRGWYWWPIGFAVILALYLIYTACAVGLCK